MEIQYLDALCATTSWHRKHVVRALGQQETVAAREPRRRNARRGRGVVERVQAARSS
jgi:hypothetical protein